MPMGATAAKFLRFYRKAKADRLLITAAQARRSAAGGTRGYMYDVMGFPRTKIRDPWGRRKRLPPKTRRPYEPSPKALALWKAELMRGSGRKKTRKK